MLVQQKEHLSHIFQDNKDSPNSIVWSAKDISFKRSNL